MTYNHLNVRIQCVFLQISYPMTTPSSMSGLGVRIAEPNALQRLINMEWRLIGDSMMNSDLEDFINGDTPKWLVYNGKPH